MLYLNKVHYPVTSLGWGRRVGIWFQGCSIRCAGCINRDTWEPKTGGIEFERLIEDIEPWLREADGVTISGGEPFDQPEMLTVLCVKVRALCRGDLLVFSGYSLEALRQNHPGILMQLDLLVSDPFLENTGPALPLRGSSNQRITFFTELARARYGGIDQSKPARRLDLTAAGGSVWMAGIPEPRLLEILRDKLAQQGIELRTSDKQLGRPCD